MLILTQAPTLFPIVFAAVVGRSTQSIANYKLERGVLLIVSWARTLVLRQALSFILTETRHWSN